MKGTFDSEIKQAIKRNPPKKGKFPPKKVPAKNEEEMPNGMVMPPRGMRPRTFGVK